MSNNKTEQVMVQCLYVVPFDTPVPLPEGKTKGDIKDMYVKWNILHVEFHNGQLWDYPLTDESEGISSARPLETRVWPMNEDGSCDYDDTLLESY